MPKNEPVPSQANYKPENVAWLIEMFAGVLHRGKMGIRFRYPNNTEYPENTNIESDDIFVDHPNESVSYLAKYSVLHRSKSKEQQRYEDRAKKSKILKQYEENSPAKIKYFQT